VSVCSSLILIWSWQLQMFSMQWLTGVPGEEELITERDWHSCITPGRCRSVISRRRCTSVKLHNCHVATTSLTHSSVSIGTACRSELHSRWRCWRNVHCTALHHFTCCRHLCVSPTRRTEEGSGLPPANVLTFQPAVSQQSEVVLFLLLVQRCGTACLAMRRQLCR